jgi:hypothetical protein
MERAIDHYQPEDCRTFFHTISGTFRREGKVVDSLIGDTTRMPNFDMIQPRGEEGSVAKFDFWAKTKNLVSGIQ